MNRLQNISNQQWIRKAIVLKLQPKAATFFLIIWLTGLAMMSCETEFTPEQSEDADQIVVEGYIEAGENPNPIFVILTKSAPFFSEISIDELNDAFVHDAKVSVTGPDGAVQLTELCLNELTEEQQVLASEVLGIETDSLAIDFCVYLDLSFSMFGEEGESYALQIEAEEQLLEAVTTVPFHSPLEELHFGDVPGVPNDTLRELRVFLDDRPDEANFYRYFTQINEGPLIAPFTSVFDDLFFDGDFFEFPLPKAELPETEFNFESYGYFEVGDTARIKFCSIDQAHYEFWSTLEFNKANQGPFSSITRVATNIEGGLGIWGAYHVSYHDLIVE